MFHRRQDPCDSVCDNVYAVVSNCESVIGSAAVSGCACATILASASGCASCLINIDTGEITQANIAAGLSTLYRECQRGGIASSTPVITTPLITLATTPSTTPGVQIVREWICCGDVSIWIYENGYVSCGGARELWFNA
jgi:hypothetical protein